ncbi:hypothetical protein EDB83DRAFT_2314341 [Lactarius deliciosus]|nr:hypothetical protein EDB83DRAFT_2314341 [Lactarius deliciosus]
MAPEDPIVEVIQFVSTHQCLADPSLLQALRNIVQGWQEKGLKGQYWGATIEKPNNIYWVLCEFTGPVFAYNRDKVAVWQSRAHAAAFAADPLYPEFVQRRQSLATTPLCVEAPVTAVDIYKAFGTCTEETHQMAHNAIRHIRSLQPQGFTGSSHGVTHEDPSVGVYVAGWNSVEDHMRFGMEEGHEKFKEEAEEFLKQLSDLTIAHITFKKHDQRRQHTAELTPTAPVLLMLSERQAVFDNVTTQGMVLKRKCDN